MSPAGRPRPRGFFTQILTRIFVGLWREWRDDVTPAGKSLVYGITLSGFGCVTLTMPIYQLFCALIVTLVCVAGVASAFRPRAEIGGDFGTRASVGGAQRCRFTVRNIGWLPAYDLCIGQTGLPAGLSTPGHSARVPELKPRATVELSLSVTPGRRGLIDVPPVRAFSLFPFGLLRSGWSFHEVPPLLVYPEPFPVGPLPIVGGGRSQVGGPMISARSGESLEYVGNRDYVPGEPIGRLDVKAWARTGRPVVKEFHSEQTATVGVMMSTAGRSGGRRVTDDAFEAAVSVTAGVIEELTAAQLGPDTFLLGATAIDLRAAGVAPREAALERLAVVEPDRGVTIDDMLETLEPRLSQLSALVCVLTDWDAAWTRLFDRVSSRGCTPGGFLVVGDGDGAGIEPPHSVRTIPARTVRESRGRQPFGSATVGSATVGGA
ncbi:MAG: DUF58 domain-containing protein [Planctomycetota bacterium]